MPDQHCIRSILAERPFDQLRSVHERYWVAVAEMDRLAVPIE